MLQHPTMVAKEQADRQAALVILGRSNFVNAGIGEKSRPLLEPVIVDAMNIVSQQAFDHELYLRVHRPSSACITVPYDRDTLSRNRAPRARSRACPARRHPCRPARPRTH